MRISVHCAVFGGLMLLLGPSCVGGSNAGGTETDASSGGGIPTTSPGSETSANTTNPATTEAGTADGGSTADGTATEGAETTADMTSGNPPPPGEPVDCGGTIYACGDTIDNDGDGFFDLFDPECTGPCDDDEGSFQTGIPGDNMDCRQDCFFDGNSGQGDDGCLWDLRCDPANPGEFINCEFTDGNNCDNQPPNQSMDCTEFCEPFVPPGCDCFGCCEVQTDMGSVWIFLNSHPDCALDNLEACSECTPQIEDCGVPCVPEECNLCFGETELPEGCEETECIAGDPCTTTDDCPPDYFCYLDCCYPPPPG